ncbi:MAG: LysM peptidoglycan-binding domain-containing protein [Coriobacteriia bacterium]|nr:LysM peptidoglycan-binding domain-containing protein [Coriobacteriia bacterium]
MDRRRHSDRSPRARAVPVLNRDVAVATVMIALLIAAVLASKSPTVDFATTSSVTVQPGDTLWSLASAHPVRGLDTAQCASAIASLNQMSGSALIAGSVVHVPSSVSPGAAVAMR